MNREVQLPERSSREISNTFLEKYKEIVTVENAMKSKIMTTQQNFGQCQGKESTYYTSVSKGAQNRYSSVIESLARETKKPENLVSTEGSAKSISDVIPVKENATRNVDRSNGSTLFLGSDISHLSIAKLLALSRNRGCGNTPEPKHLAASLSYSASEAVLLTESTLEQSADKAPEMTPFSCTPILPHNPASGTQNSLCKDALSPNSLPPGSDSEELQYFNQTKEHKAKESSRSSKPVSEEDSEENNSHRSISHDQPVPIIRFYQRNENQIPSSNPGKIRVKTENIGVPFDHKSSCQSWNSWSDSDIRDVMKNDVCVIDETNKRTKIMSTHINVFNNDKTESHSRHASPHIPQRHFKSDILDSTEALTKNSSEHDLDYELRHSGKKVENFVHENSPFLPEKILSANSGTIIHENEARLSKNFRQPNLHHSEDIEDRFGLVGSGGLQVHLFQSVPLSCSDTILRDLSGHYVKHTVSVEDHNVTKPGKLIHKRAVISSGDAENMFQKPITKKERMVIHQKVQTFICSSQKGTSKSDLIRDGEQLEEVEHTWPSKHQIAAEDWESEKDIFSLKQEQYASELFQKILNMEESVPDDSWKLQSKDDSGKMKQQESHKKSTLQVKDESEDDIPQATGAEFSRFPHGSSVFRFPFLPPHFNKRFTSGSISPLSTSSFLPRSSQMLPSPFSNSSSP